MRASQARLRLVYATLELQRPGDHRHHRVIAVVADAHLHFPAEVDAVDEFEEAVHEMLTRLLAVRNDIDAGILLRLDPQERRVALCALELGARASPGGPELLRFGQPLRLRQASRDGRF